MKYKILTSTSFEKEFKKLAKKHKSLKSDISELFNSLQENPEQGVSLGKNCHKIRLAISSKGKGKSGGARVITQFQVINDTIYLLSIFDKSDKDTISDKELIALIESILK
jgi:mRNA-degrading endonuclease RelE of RelBE toxin-antitoxin system